MNSISDTLDLLDQMVGLTQSSLISMSIPRNYCF